MSESQVLLNIPVEGSDPELQSMNYLRWIMEYGSMHLSDEAKGRVVEWFYARYKDKQA